MNGLTQYEEKTLVELGFYDDLALRRSVMEFQKDGVGPLEVFEALAAVRAKGIDTKAWLAEMVN